MAEERVTINACQGWGCHEHCMLRTYSKDGKIVRTQRLPLPGPKPDNGICAKGIMAAKIPYAEDRILYPLKRVGERGEGKFERVSWDQAIKEVSEKLLELREKYGSESVIVNDFWCGYPGDYRSLQNALIFRFIHTWGASLMEYTDVDKAPSFMNMIEYGTYSTTDNKQITEAKNEIIIWGGNPLGFTRPTVTSEMLLDAQERGVKLVHISNMFDTTSAKVDQWVPVKSGTDCALALAMANYIVQQNEVDEDYLIDMTVAPFLVREDNGKFLHESDVIEGGSPVNYVYIDAETGSLTFHAPYTKCATVPNINAEVEAGGTTCKTAYVKLKEHLAPWTPERQEELTGVPAETCVQLIREYLDNRPSTIYIYYGFRYRNGTQSARAIHLIALLSGNLGMPGGRFIVSGSADSCVRYTALNDAPLMFPYGMQGLKGDHVSLLQVLGSFEDPSVQQYKAWLNPMGNPILNWPNKDLWLKRILPNLELFVSWEIRMSDTARYADYVFPETTAFEREDILIGPDDCVALQTPAIDPIGESKNPTDIWNMLAKNLGMDEYWILSTEDYNRIRLDNHVIENDNDVQSSAADPTHQQGCYTEGITYEMLKETPEARHLNVPMKFYDYYADPDISTPSGRIEFYAEKLAEVNEPMATYEPAIIHDHPTKDQYPLHFFPGRHKYFMQGQFTNIPELRLLADSQFGCALNPVTAKERGLKDGDMVEVYNQRGSMFVPLHVRKFIPPGMAHCWYSYPWPTYGDNEPPQKLATPENTEESESAVSKLYGPYNYNLGREAGIPPTLCIMTGLTTNEVFWDSLCEVRKAEKEA